MERVTTYVPEEGERLGESESFFLEMRDVPRLEQRLLICRMKHNFSSIMMTLRSSIKMYQEACQDVLHSEVSSALSSTLPRILTLILMHILTPIDPDPDPNPIHGHPRSYDVS